VALILLMLAGSYGCSVRDPWQDARIEGEVKARLVAEKNANLTRLGVVSRQAVVYLSGTVASADEKALAETLAKSVGGVRRVVSTLEIRPPAAEEGRLRTYGAEPGGGARRRGSLAQGRRHRDGRLLQLQGVATDGARRDPSKRLRRAAVVLVSR
jgi:hypothetical protein